VEQGFPERAERLGKPDGLRHEGSSLCPLLPSVSSVSSVFQLPAFPVGTFLASLWR